jgi:hypothetical protein
MADKIVKKLPRALQTTAIKNFFESTVEQLFSQASSDTIQGLIGRKIGGDQTIISSYIPEPSNPREFYSLTPAVNNLNTSTATSENLIFYDEFIDTLRTYGVDTRNHNKIFGSQYQTFLPPIDPDKLINYQEYYWVPEGPSTIDIQGSAANPINIDTDVLGQKFFTPANGKEFRTGMVVRFIGDWITPITKINTEYIVEGVGTKIILVPKIQDFTAKFSSIVQDGYDASVFTSIDLGVRHSAAPITSVEIISNGIGYINPIGSILGANIAPANIELVTNGQGSIIDVIVHDGGEGYSGQLSVLVEDTEVSTQINSAVMLDGGNISVILTDSFVVNDTANIKPGQAVSGAISGIVQSVDAGNSTIVLVDAVTFDGTETTVEFVGIGFQATVECSDMATTTGNNIDILNTQARVGVDPVTGMFYLIGGLYSYDTVPWGGISDQKQPDYILIGRGSRNRNIWSRINFWYHRENFLDAGDEIPESIKRAQRPIIEFDRDIEMFNHGRIGRGSVSIAAVGKFPSEFEGQPVDTLVDDAPLVGSTIVFPETEVGISQYVYTAKDNAGILQLVRIADPETNPIGAEDGDETFVPLVLALGDSVSVRQGATGRGLEYHMTEQGLQLAQSKLSVNQQPLFNLYDDNRIYLGDSIVYPFSTFAGNKIFSYAIGQGADDSVLGIPLEYKPFKVSSEILFQNNINTDRVEYTVPGTVQRQEVLGYYFYRTNESVPVYNTYWKNSESPNRQHIYTSYQIDQFDVDNNQLEWDIGCIPSSGPNGLEFVAKVNGIKTNQFEYTNNGSVKLASGELAIGDYIEFFVFSDQGLISEESSSQFEIPMSWRANPDNKEINEISEPEFLPHFKGLIENQPEFSGNALASNNYSSSSKQAKWARDIVQTDQDLILAAFLLDDQPHNLINSIRFCSREYEKYIARLRKEIDNYFMMFDTAGLSNEYILEQVLRNVITYTIGKKVFNDTYVVPFGDNYVTETRVWATSQPRTFTLDQSVDLDQLENSLLVYVSTNGVPVELLNNDIDFVVNSFSPISITISDSVPLITGSRIYFKIYSFGRDSAQCPPTPSTMGLYPLYPPRLEIDSSFKNPITVIVGHDGSKTVALGDQRDMILLEFEKRVYNAAKSEFRLANSLPELNITSVKPGAFRDTGFVLQEWHDLTRPAFSDWSYRNKTDWVKNEFYTEDDEWSWNYSSTSAPGFWRGWYLYYYDTVAPNTAPWEMLGFTEQPQWWTAQYGTDYSSNNTELWLDLELGAIRQGRRANITNNAYQNNNPFARPGLADFLPVDSAQQLRSPSAILGISAPATASYAWKFGDVSPVENAWRYSVGYPFAVVEALLLAKPGKFANVFADPTRIIRPPANPGMIIDRVTRRRWDYVSPESFRIHGELRNGNVVTNIGYTQFINSWLAFQGYDTTADFAEKMRLVNIKLAHRFAGFVDKDTMSVRTDQLSRSGSATGLLIPEEDVTVLIHSSPYKTRNFYTGVVVEKVTNGYRVSGYDRVLGYFMTQPADKTGPREVIEVGGTPANFADWTQNVTYKKDAIVQYRNSFFQARSSVAASEQFSESLWTRLPSLPQIGARTGVVYQIGLDEIARVDYGTIFETTEQVFEFMVDLGRYQKKIGFKFGDYDGEINDIRDWIYSAKQFLFWSQEAWQTGNTLELSPLAAGIRFEKEVGFISKINRVERNQFTLLDAAGAAVQPDDCEIIREDDYIEIKPPVGQQLYGVLLFTREIEHAMLVNNATIFGDVIQDTLLNQRHERLKIKAKRTSNWKGRMLSSGFIVQGDQLLPNLDNMAQTIGRYHETGFIPVEKQLYVSARRQFGYEERDYMRNLDILDDQQFDFYRGMIQNKGTSQSLTRIAKSNAIVQGNLTVFDEWALKLAEFGDVENSQSIEVKLARTDFVQNPQLVTLAFPQDTTGIVKEIIVLSSTNIYSSPPEIIISPPELDGEVAQARATLSSDGYLASVEVVNPGSGYTAPPGVDIIAATMVTTTKTVQFVEASIRSQDWIGNISALANIVVVDHIANTGNIEVDLSGIVSHDEIATRINNEDIGITAKIYENLLIDQIDETTSVTTAVFTLQLTGSDFSVVSAPAELFIPTGRYQPRQRYAIEVTNQTTESDILVKVDGDIVGSDHWDFETGNTQVFATPSMASVTFGSYSLSIPIALQANNVTELNGTYPFLRVFVDGVEIINSFQNGTVYTITTTSITFPDVTLLPAGRVDSGMVITVRERATIEFDDAYQGDLPGRQLTVQVFTRDSISVQLGYVRNYEITPNDPNDETILIDIDDTGRFLKKPCGCRNQRLWPLNNNITHKGIRDVKYNGLPNAGYVNPKTINYQAFSLNDLPGLFGAAVITKPTVGETVHVAVSENKDWNVYQLNPVFSQSSYLEDSGSGAVLFSEANLLSFIDTNQIAAADTGRFLDQYLVIKKSGLENELVKWTNQQLIRKESLVMRDFTAPKMVQAKIARIEPAVLLEIANISPFITSSYPVGNISVTGNVATVSLSTLGNMRDGDYVSFSSTGDDQLSGNVDVTFVSPGEILCNAQSSGANISYVTAGSTVSLFATTDANVYGQAFYVSSVELGADRFTVVDPYFANTDVVSGLGTVSFNSYQTSYFSTTPVFQISNVNVSSVSFTVSAAGATNEPAEVLVLKHLGGTEIETTTEHNVKAGDSVKLFANSYSGIYHVSSATDNTLTVSAPFQPQAGNVGWVTTDSVKVTTVSNHSLSPKYAGKRMMIHSAKPQNLNRVLAVKSIPSPNTVVLKDAFPMSPAAFVYNNIEDAYVSQSSNTVLLDLYPSLNKVEVRYTGNAQLVSPEFYQINPANIVFQANVLPSDANTTVGVSITRSLVTNKPPVISTLDHNRVKLNGFGVSLENMNSLPAVTNSINRTIGLRQAAITSAELTVEWNMLNRYDMPIVFDSSIKSKQVGSQSTGKKPAYATPGLYPFVKDLSEFNLDDSVTIGSIVLSSTVDAKLDRNFQRNVVHNPMLSWWENSTYRFSDAAVQTTFNDIFNPNQTQGLYFTPPDITGSVATTIAGYDMTETQVVSSETYPKYRLQFARIGVYSVYQIEAVNGPYYKHIADVIAPVDNFAFWANLAAYSDFVDVGKQPRNSVYVVEPSRSAYIAVVPVAQPALMPPGDNQINLLNYFQQVLEIESSQGEEYVANNIGRPVLRHRLNSSLVGDTPIGVKDANAAIAALGEGFDPTPVLETLEVWCSWAVQHTYPTQTRGYTTSGDPIIESYVGTKIQGAYIRIAQLSPAAFTKLLLPNTGFVAKPSSESFTNIPAILQSNLVDTEVPTLNGHPVNNMNVFERAAARTCEVEPLVRVSANHTNISVGEAASILIQEIDGSPSTPSEQINDVRVFRVAGKSFADITFYFGPDFDTNNGCGLTVEQASSANSTVWHWVADTQSGNLAPLYTNSTVLQFPSNKQSAFGLLDKDIAYYSLTPATVESTVWKKRNIGVRGAGQIRFWVDASRGQFLRVTVGKGVGVNSFVYLLDYTAPVVPDRSGEWEEYTWQANETSGFAIGAEYKQYIGYFADDPYYTATKPPVRIIRRKNTSRFSIPEHTTYDIFGYFAAPETGVYTFALTSSDAGYMWVGESAVSGYTVANSLIANGGLHRERTRTETITLTQGEFYPIRIIAGNSKQLGVIEVLYSVNNLIDKPVVFTGSSSDSDEPDQSTGISAMGPESPIFQPVGSPVYNTENQTTSTDFMYHPSWGRSVQGFNSNGRPVNGSFEFIPDIFRRESITTGAKKFGFSIDLPQDKFANATAQRVTGGIVLPHSIQLKGVRILPPQLLLGIDIQFEPWFGGINSSFQSGASYRYNPLRISYTKVLEDGSVVRNIADSVEDTDENVIEIVNTLSVPGTLPSDAIYAEVSAELSSEVDSVTIPSEYAPVDVESEIEFNLIPTIVITPKTFASGAAEAAGPTVEIPLFKPTPMTMIRSSIIRTINQTSELVFNGKPIVFSSGSLSEFVNRINGADAGVKATAVAGSNDESYVILYSCSSSSIRITNGCQGGRNKEIADFHLVRGDTRTITETSNTSVIPAATGYMDSVSGDDISFSSTAANPQHTYTLYNADGSSAGTLSNAGTLSAGAVLSSISETYSSSAGGYSVGDRLRLVGGSAIAAPFTTIKNILITSGGSGYSSANNLVVTIGDGSTPGYGASAIVTQLSPTGAVTAIQVTNGGVGYDMTRPPIVTIVDSKPTTQWVNWTMQAGTTYTVDTVVKWSINNSTVYYRVLEEITTTGAAPEADLLLGKLIQVSDPTSPKRPARLTAGLDVLQSGPPRVAKFIVDQVDSNGSIIKLRVIDRGVYSVFPETVSDGVPLEYDYVQLQNGIPGTLGKIDPINNGIVYSPESPGAYDPAAGKVYKNNDPAQGIAGGTGAKVYLTSVEIADCSDPGTLREQLELPEQIDTVNTPISFVMDINAGLAKAGYSSKDLLFTVDSLTADISTVKIETTYPVIEIESTTPGFLEQLGIEPGDYAFDMLNISARIVDGGNYIDTVTEIETDPNSIFGDAEIYSVDALYRYDITDATGLPVEISSERVPAEALYFESLRYSTIEDFVNRSKVLGSNPTPTIDDDVVASGNIASQPKLWVDDYQGQGWAYIEFGEPVYKQEPLVDVEFIKNSMFYDSDSGNRLLELNNWDPFKGIIPGFLASEITYQSEHDPVNYDPTRTRFGRNTVGETWWDTSAVRYHWYEQGSDRERWLNWASTFPGSAILIYEWVESLQLPTNYTGSGLPVFADRYIAETRWDPETFTNKTYYYFWVLGKETVEGPAVTKLNRKLDARAIARHLANPTGLNLPLVSFISTKSLVLTNGIQNLRDEDNILQINFSRDQNRDGLKHVSWQLVRENDPSSVIPEDLSIKLIDSLCGFNAIGQPVPDPMFSEVEQLGVKFRPRQNMFRDVPAARRILVEVLNNILSDIKMYTEYPLWDKDLPTVRKYIQKVNWYAVDYVSEDNVTIRYTAQSKPVFTVAGVSELRGYTNVPDGTVVQVQTNLRSRYQLWRYSAQAKTYELIASELDTVKLTDATYTDETNTTLAHELRYLLLALKDQVFANSSKWNQLFFAMMKHAYSEQQQLDWAFKTSYLYVEKDEQDLIQYAGFKPDNFENILAYMNEVKPYSAKVREYADTKSAPVEIIAKLGISDYDKPPFADPVTGKVRILDDFDQIDTDIMANDSEYQRYLSVFNKWDSPIRRIEITQLFDRVRWDLTAWDWDTSNESISSSIARHISLLMSSSNDFINTNSNTRAVDRAFKFTPQVQQAFKAEMSAHTGLALPDLSNTTVLEQAIESGNLNVTLALVKHVADGNFRGETVDASLFARFVAGLDSTSDTVSQLAFDSESWDLFLWDNFVEVMNFAGVFNENTQGSVNFARDGALYQGFDGVTFKRMLYGEERPEELVMLKPLESLVMQVQTSNYTLNDSEAGELVATNAQPVGFQVHWDIYGKTEWLRISTEFETTIAQDVFDYSSDITVIDSSVLAQPSELGPGILWLGDERIEYKRLIGNTISNLTRGTNGTSIQTWLAATAPRVIPGDVPQQFGHLDPEQAVWLDSGAASLADVANVSSNASIMRFLHGL